MGVYREPIKVVLEQELNLTIASLNKTQKMLLMILGITQKYIN